MSDWEESSSSPEAGQQAFHEAVTPVQSSPSESERDEDDFDGSASRGIPPEVGLEGEESSSDDEDVSSATAESATQLVDKSREPVGEEQTGKSAFNYEDAEDGASNDEDKPLSAASGKDDSVDGGDQYEEEGPSKEDISDDEEKDEDAR